VAAVLPDVMRYATTAKTATVPTPSTGATAATFPTPPGGSSADNAEATFLGLTGRNGLWAKGYTGAGVVVGVIDTGVWPEHPSFADDGTFPAPTVTLTNTPANPSCNFGNTAKNPLDAPFTCNNKLIGARDARHVPCGQRPRAGRVRLRSR
jgi:subtilisin family serine protease